MTSKVNIEKEGEKPADGKQSTTGRIIGSVPLPPAKRLTITELFDENNKPRTNILKEHLKQEGRLSEECAIKIIKDGMKFKKITLSDNELLCSPIYYLKVC